MKRASLAEDPRLIERLLARASSLVGSKSFVIEGVRYRGDCSGFIHAIYDPLGVSVGPGSAADMLAFLREHGSVRVDRPVPGDLVLFRDTYDKNRNGRMDDGITHVALVEAVDALGRVTLLHRVRRGVLRERMSLGEPSRVVDPATGLRVNDILRQSPRRLTSELFVAYATPPELILPRIALNWSPTPDMARACDPRLSKP